MCVVHLSVWLLTAFVKIYTFIFLFLVLWLLLFASDWEFIVHIKWLSLRKVHFCQNLGKNVLKIGFFKSDSPKCFPQIILQDFQTVISQEIIKLWCSCFFQATKCFYSYPMELEMVFFAWFWSGTHRMCSFGPDQLDCRIIETAITQSLKYWVIFFCTWSNIHRCQRSMQLTRHAKSASK